MEGIEEKLTVIKDDLGDKIDAKLKEHGENTHQMGDDLKAEFKGEIKELVSKNEDLQKQLDALDAGVQKGISSQPTTFKGELGKALSSNEDYAAWRKGNSDKATFQLKAALTTPLNASGDVVPSDRIAGYKYDPTRAVRVRQFLPTIGMAGNRLQYVQELSYTNNAATRAESSAYGESEFRLEAAEAPARSIGSIITLSKEMLEDVPALTGYISTRLPAKVQNVEDTQLLLGNGSAPNLQGIMTSGGGAAFDATAAGFNGFFGADASAYTNEFDVLVAAKNQATLLEYSPSVTLLNPTDYAKMLLRKDANANYVTFVNGVLTVYGIPIFQNTAIPSGKFVIGDFAQALTMGQRDALSVEFATQNNDDFERDLITVKGSERIALAIHNPNAIVWGTFSTAITAMNA